MMGSSAVVINNVETLHINRPVINSFTMYMRE